MKPEQLKESILKSAFEGKLLEQNGSDENVDYLLKRIENTRVTAIKCGEIKKNKKLEKITDDDIPSVIPSSWSYLRLGDVSQLIDGEKRKGHEYNYLEVKYLRGEKEPKKLNEGKFVTKGKIVILVDGENSGEVFKLPEDGYLGSTLKVLYISPEMDKNYVLNFFELKRSELRENKKGAAIPHLNKDLLFNYVLPIPPLEEQHRIVTKIEELLPFVDRYAEVYDKLKKFNAKFQEDMKKSILQYAMQGKLVEQKAEEGTAEELYKKIQDEKAKLIKEGKIKKEKHLKDITDDEIPFEIPESWKWVRIYDIYELTMGQSPDGKSVSKGIDGMEFHQGKIFFGDDYISKSNQVTSEPSKIAEPHSVLLCVRAPVGIVNITDRKLCIGRGLCAVKPLAGMTDKYALYSLRYLKDEFIKKATGTTFVAITGEVIKNQIVPLPPLEEQHRIVSKIEELFSFIDRYAEVYENFKN